jgi:tetratricopeptide (TPR) repeat protein
LYALQFQFPSALFHFQKAYAYRPENPKYAFDYGWALQNQGELHQAEGVYREMLKHLSEFRQPYPPEIRAWRAAILLNLAVLYGEPEIARFDLAANLFGELLDIYRELAIANPQQYEPTLAACMLDYAELLRKRKDFVGAQKAYDQALQGYCSLERNNPGGFQARIAAVYEDRFLMYADQGKWKEADGDSQAGLSRLRSLAHANPTAYEPLLGGALNNMTFSYFKRGQFEQAGKYAEQAITLYRRLLAANPSVFGIPLLNNLMWLAQIRDIRKSDTSKVCELVQEALRVNPEPQLPVEPQELVERCASANK